MYTLYMSFPGGTVVKNPAANAGNTGVMQIPSLRVGNDNPLQHSCLENTMDRGAWWAAVPRVGHEGSNLARTANK